MKLEGSCHCGAVSFTVNSRTPYPYNHCYCSKCGKTGGAGFGINIMADADTLVVSGEENISVYRSANNHKGAYEADGLGYSRRHFCKTCASPLWTFNPQYAEWVYPFASAIDTPLPPAPARTHLMLAYKAPWVPVPQGAGETHFEHYPDQGIEDWHKARGLFEEG